MQNTHITANHKIIRQWVEERNGIPGRIAENQTPTEDEGVLDIRFSDSKTAKKLIPLSWNDFFSRFDQCHLAFEYEDATYDGQKSRFFKFISRDGE